MKGVLHWKWTLTIIIIANNTCTHIAEYEMIAIHAMRLALHFGWRNKQNNWICDSFVLIIAYFSLFVVFSFEIIWEEWKESVELQKQSEERRRW